MPEFSKTSIDRLNTCHPLLQDIMKRAIKEYDFVVLCGHRGKEDQDRAVREGNSKTPWPKSKHNATPSLAVDIAPYPIDWNDRKRFGELAAVVMRIAKQRGVKLRWGGDFNMDGDKTTRDSWDLPHFELVGHG